MWIVRTILGIAAYRLVQLIRDRVGLFFTFLLPLLIIALLVAAIPGRDLSVGVVLNDRSPLAEELSTALDSAEGFSAREYDDEDALRTATRRGEVAAGVLVPSGYDAALRADEPTTVMLILDRSNPDATSVRTRVAAAIADQSALVTASRFASAETGMSFEAALAIARAVGGSPDSPAIQVSTAGVSAFAHVGIAEYATAGELILFLFIVGLAGASDLVESRRLGVTRRMLATPTPTWAVLAGEGLGRFGIAVVQAIVIVGVGSLVFGIGWGDTVAVIALVLSFSLLVVGASLIIGAVAPSAEFAGSVGPPIGIALGMLGGCMWPLEIVPEPMVIVGHITPHAWAVDAFLDVMGGGAGLPDIWRELGVLLGFAAALLAAGVWLLRRSVVR